MKGIKLKAVLAGRKAALLGVAVAVAGLSLLSGAPAHAALGTQPGTLTISPSTGPLTTVPTWSTTIACPSDANASAKLDEVGLDGVTLTPWSASINNAAAPLSNETVVASATVGTFEAIAGYTSGQTAELVVYCFSGPNGSGTAVPYMDTWIQFNSDSATYTTGPDLVPAPTTPTVTLFASPSPVQVGASVTLTALVMTGTGPVPIGTVQFENNGTAIGSPVALGPSGVASTTTTFTSTGALPLTAVYQPANTALTNATSSTVSENVTATNPVGELITATVAPSGSFTFTGTANASAALTQSGNTATGTLAPVTVTDTRTGLAPDSSIPSLVNGFSGYPGWSVVGQATDFTDPTSSPAGDIPAANFNWTPTTTTTGDFTLGAASTGGLGTTQVLADAHTGHGDGTFTLGANLSLAIPTTAPAGPYSSTLTLTANPTANFP